MINFFFVFLHGEIDKINITITINITNNLDEPHSFYIPGIFDSGHEVPLVISDHQMPGITGVELLKEVRRRCADTARLLLTGQAGERAVMDGINSGAIQYYVRKEYMDESDFDVYIGVDLLLRNWHLEREAKAKQETLNHIAMELHKQALPQKLPRTTSAEIRIQGA